MIFQNVFSNKTRIILDILVLILLLVGVGFVYTEIVYMKNHGGDCLHNPMAWAEKYALEETGMYIDCNCEKTHFFDFELNSTGGKSNE